MPANVQSLIEINQVVFSLLPEMLEQTYMKAHILTHSCTSDPTASSFPLQSMDVIMTLAQKPDSTVFQSLGLTRGYNYVAKMFPKHWKTPLLAPSLGQYR